MISFTPVEINRSLRDLLDATFEGRGGTVVPESVDAVLAHTFVPMDKVPSRTKSSTGPIGSRR